MSEPTPLRASFAAASGGAARTRVHASAWHAFRNRLQKNYRHWSRWARRRGAGAFRVYDRDLPEFPLAIDVYVPVGAEGAVRVHLQEFDTGWVQERHEHAVWVQTVRASVAETLPAAPAHIAWKHRPRRRAGVQHEPTGAGGEAFQIAEQGLRFWVNLEAHLDTGLFIDHRAMRAMVRSCAAGRRMLNLFAYTGSFTVYAAAGGAPESVTVDLSNAYLAWARRNFAANGLDAGKHRLVRADASRWLPEAVAAHERFGLIVLDPPAFSNSKAMTRVFDVQRDHRALIAACLDLLAPGGELFFSTNLRSFALDSGLTRIARDITGETRAEDFRDRRVHRAYRFAAR